MDPRELLPDADGCGGGGGFAWVAKEVLAPPPAAASGGGSRDDAAASRAVDGDSAAVHFVGRAVGAPEPLVDTRSLLRKPFDLRLGKAFVVPELEDAVRSMALGERARFRFASSIMPAFSQLVTVLRRQHRESKDGCGQANEDKHHHHGCCAAHMGGDDATRDLREALGSEIELDIELVGVQRGGTYERDSWELTWAEKIQSVLDHKHAGNAAVARKEYDAAARQYETAIGLVESVRLAHKAGEIETEGGGSGTTTTSSSSGGGGGGDAGCEGGARAAADPQRALDEHVPLLLNYTLCMLKLKNYRDAVVHASIVLRVDPDNVKALYRRGQAHLERGRDLDDALSDLERAHKIQPGNDAVKRLLDKCRREAAAAAKQDRARFKGMFG